MRSFAVVSFLAVCALAPAAVAQSPLPASGAGSDAALAAKLAHDAEIADQDRRSEALNVEINRKNAAVEARNRATRAAYEQAQADYRTALAAHDAEVARLRADAEKAQAAYAKAQADWTARVAACKAGDAKSCQPAGAPGSCSRSNRAPLGFSRLAAHTA